MTLQRAFFRLAALSGGTAMAAGQDFLLGVANTTPIFAGKNSSVDNLSAATDSQGNLYMLLNGTTDTWPGSPVSYMAKVTPSGDKILYQTMVPSTVTAMAVDAAGNAYLAGGNSVEKLSPDGATVLYQTVIGELGLDTVAIAVDGATLGSAIAATPGAYESTPPPGDAGFVVRLKPSGAIDYGTYLGNSSPAGVGVDSTGSAFVTGAAFPVNPFLVRLAADGSGLIYSNSSVVGTACCVALDPAGNAVVALQNPTGSVVMRLDPQGGVVFSKTVAGARTARSWASRCLPVFCRSAWTSQRPFFSARKLFRSQCNTPARRRSRWRG